MVGADDHVYPNFPDVMRYLADSDLLEMIVDKLNPSVSSKILGYSKIEKRLEALYLMNLGDSKFGIVRGYQKRKITKGIYH